MFYQYYSKDKPKVGGTSAGEPIIYHSHTDKTKNPIQLKACAAYFNQVKNDPRTKPEYAAAAAFAAAEDEAVIAEIEYRRDCEKREHEERMLRKPKP